MCMLFYCVTSVTTIDAAEVNFSVKSCLEICLFSGFLPRNVQWVIIRAFQSIEMIKKLGVCHPCYCHPCYPVCGNRGDKSWQVTPVTVTEMTCVPNYSIVRVQKFKEQGLGHELCQSKCSGLYTLFSGYKSQCFVTIVTPVTILVTPVTVTPVTTYVCANGWQVTPVTETEVTFTSYYRVVCVQKLKKQGVGVRNVAK